MLWQRLRVLTSLSSALIVVLALGSQSRLCSAATIAYGDLGPIAPGVMFTDIKESSGTDAVPLHGPPDAFAVGLDFDPASFAATANGGNEDITEGQVNFTIMGNVDGPNFVGIGTINLFEAGDYSLVGGGTAATQALAGAIMRAAVTQIDGVNVAPIDLTPVNASVGFNLAANSGTVQPWSLGLSLNVGGQLAARGVPFLAGATKVEVVIDNQLIALSQPDSLAFIAKKEFRIDVDEEFIPEPSTALLGGLALCGLGLAVRRRGG